MRLARNLRSGGDVALILALALGGCSKIKANDPQDTGKVRAAAKRHQAACGSSTAYDRLKGLLFDQAIGQHSGSRANLDILADYSVVRMENPIVASWDPALDLTRCKGHFIIELPPGAERAFGGERRLQANIDYTAQAAADGTGLVYQIQGAEPLVAKLAAFDLTGRAFRPPAAIDEQPTDTAAPEPAEIAAAEVPTQAASETPAHPEIGTRSPALPEATEPEATEPEPAAPEPRNPASGEAAIRSFYNALGMGNGSVAAAVIVPEKRASRAFSPAAMTRFYGGLREPIRLTGIEALSPGAYRVSYRYSAGRTRCDGNAIIHLTNRSGRNFIRSITALNGC